MKHLLQPGIEPVHSDGDENSQGAKQQQDGRDKSSGRNKPFPIFLFRHDKSSLVELDSYDTYDGTTNVEQHASGPNNGVCLERHEFVPNGAGVERKPPSEPGLTPLDVSEVRPENVVADEG
jgi:hypothetical protein